MAALESAISREVESVRILALYGEEIRCQTIAESIASLSCYDLSSGRNLEHCKFEIYVRFRNGSKVEGTFTTKEEALEFLGLFA